jgi:hypothetical protein
MCCDGYTFTVLDRCYLQIQLPTAFGLGFQTLVVRVDTAEGLEEGLRGTEWRAVESGWSRKEHSVSVEVVEQ